MKIRTRPSSLAAAGRPPWRAPPGLQMVDVDLSGDLILSYICSIIAVMLAEARQLGEQAAKLAATPLWPLADDELTDALHAARRLEQAAAALQARIVREAAARGLPTRHGHRSATGWLRSTLRLDPRLAREKTTHAAALDSPAIEEAVLDGRVDLPQATVIAATAESIATELTDLDKPRDPSDPRELGVADIAQIARQAEQTMIEMAARLPAYPLTSSARSARASSPTSPRRSPTAPTRPPWLARRPGPTSAAASPFPYRSTEWSASPERSEPKTPPSCTPPCTPCVPPLPTTTAPPHNAAPTPSSTSAASPYAPANYPTTAANPHN